MNAKQRRAAKRAEVRHNPKAVGRPPKIGVEKGRGPRHADNAKEGEDLTSINTDTVPAMLTPREAVLNRNAAEMAGRGNIEALNEKGNELAKQGVDLAGGENDMKQSRLSGANERGVREKLQGGGYADPLGKRNIDPYGGGRPMPVARPAPAPSPRPGGYQSGGPDPLGGAGPQRVPYAGADPGVPPVYSASGLPGMAAVPPQMPPGGSVQTANTLPGQSAMPAPWAGGGDPVQGGGNVNPLKFGSSFYPKGQGFAGGTEDILGGGESIYGGSAPVNLSAPSGLAEMVAAIKKEGAKQGLSPSQIQGIIGAFGGAGGGMASYGEGSATSQALGPALEGAFPGYQGGISEIGYPPFIAPGADFHGDKGGWIGQYDPAYMVPRYL